MRIRHFRTGNRSLVGVNYIQSSDRFVERPTRVNHLNAMLDGNLDNLVAGKISSHGGVLAALANDVGLVGLCEIVSSVLGR